MTWDIFCTVIDNYGDIGVTWRLARQLAREHGVPVRLWVDDLAAFSRIRPEIDPERDTQRLDGVEIRRWTSPLADVEPGEVVIEALACDLPEAFVARMAARAPGPLWLNLEYLTAEAWAAGVHGLPSPHPRLPLTKYFFMPGYQAGTGGLTREAGLTEERDRFRADPAARSAFWAGLGLPPEAPGEPRVSLFCYDNAALPGLLAAWAGEDRPSRVLVPLGKAVPAIAAWFGLAAPPQPGATLCRGALTLHVLPMLDQDAYDRLLWACDLNFVRGEDSFVRAQFAARPLVWQAYRQEAGAHFAKLEAFLDLYVAGMDAGLAALTREVWRAWNRESDVAAHWPAWRDALPRLERHASMWCDRLAENADTASNLLIFCKKKLE
jgi:uncharacterized repeat protein (TIGR03837 family)